MASVFSKIITGEIPCYKVAENEHCLAFLDINPNAKGHTLCIPKREEDKIFDLSEKEYHQLMQFSYNVAQALRNTVSCKRIGMSVIGLEVPHAHVHLIPLDTMKDATFQTKVHLDKEAFQALAEAIQANYNTL